MRQPPDITVQEGDGDDRGDGWKRFATYGHQDENLPNAYRCAAEQRREGYRARVVRAERHDAFRGGLYIEVHCKPGYLRAEGA